MEIKFEKFGDMIVYKCPICHKELIIKVHGFVGLTNNCDHYKAYTIIQSQYDQCSKSKKEIEFVDENGLKYIICRK